MARIIVQADWDVDVPARRLPAGASPWRRKPIRSAAPTGSAAPGSGWPTLGRWHLPLTGLDKPDAFHVTMSGVHRLRDSSADAPVMNAHSIPLLPLRLCARGLSPGGRWGRLTTLIYHRVLAETDPLQPEILDTAAFEAQLRMVRSLFQVVPLGQAIEALKAGRLPARCACITFDDGYADNLTHALPVLQRLRLHATFFIATDYLDGGQMFNDTIIEAVRDAPAGEHDLTRLGLARFTLRSKADRIGAIARILHGVKYLPFSERAERVDEIARQLGGAPPSKQLMMTTAQLRELHAAGMEIGAHTASHPILARLEDTEARDDIERGKHRLEDLLSAEIRLFAYPNGRPGQDYGAPHVRMLRELGFAGAVSTATGVATRSTDHYQLPRFTPWSRNTARSALMLLRNLALRQPRPALV